MRRELSLIVVASAAVAATSVPAGASGQCVYQNGTTISITLENCRKELPPIGVATSGAANDSDGDCIVIRGTDISIALANCLTELPPIGG